MPIYSFGKKHAELSQWLVQHWLKEGPPVCFIEGFSGVGKTSVAREVICNTDIKAPTVYMPDANEDQADSLFFNLAAALSHDGIDDLSAVVMEGKVLNTALPALLALLSRKKILIIIDEFQRALDSHGKPHPPILRILDALASRPSMPGRLLLLTNQLVERSRWSEAHEKRPLEGLNLDDAAQLLDHLLRDLGRSAEIPPERRRDVVQWLGGNPRAIHVLVAALERSSLDELIGISPDLWESRDRSVSAELLHQLERELLERTLEHLSPKTVRLLQRLSVHRKAVQREAIEPLLPGGVAFAAARDSLIDRFLMEQHMGWFALNPVVREIALTKLRGQASEFRQAHSHAASYYTRHFEAREIKDNGRLGGHFVEARYHLAQSGREADLTQIARRFEVHLKASFTAVSPVPSQLDVLNERIITLSALLETPGSKGLEYYLARLYEARRAEGDIERALHYIRRATGPRAPADAWVLRLRLEAQLSGPDQVLRVAREGIARVPVEKNVFALYQSAGELLAQAGRTDEAIALLQDGIAKIPPDKSSASLYQSAAELFARTGRADQAIALLQDGIAKIPVDKNAASLYQSAAELLARAGRTDEAITLLQNNIAQIPPDKGLFTLYQNAGKLLFQAGHTDKAIALLKSGISAIPVGMYSRYKLAEQMFNILLATQQVQMIDDLLAETSSLAIEAFQVALGKVYRLMIQRQWYEAAQLARQESTRLPSYRPLMQTEAFCWLCTHNLSAAHEALSRIIMGDQPFDAAHWLRTWIALKQGDPERARTSLSLYLGRPAADAELSEQFLLELWDTAPTLGERDDLAYFFPILPSALTGLPGDVARTAYGPSVIAGRGAS